MATAATGQNNFRFYADDNADVDSCTAIAAEGATTGTIALDTPFHVRISSWNDNSAVCNSTALVQARVNGGGWFNVTTSSTYVRTSTGLPTDGVNCDTQLLSSYSSYTWESDGEYDDGDGVLESSAHAKSTFWEDQFCVVLRSAELSADDYVEFNIVPTGATRSAPATYAGITAEAAGAIEGLATSWMRLEAGATPTVTLPSANADGLVLGDTSAGAASTAVTLSDGLTLGDTAAAATGMADALSDGLVFGDRTVGNPMVLTMETTGATEEQRTVRIPFAVTSLNVDIDWGDGNEDTGVTTANPEHVYVAEGTYTILVTGTARGLGSGFTTASTRWSTKLRSVVQWGDLGLTSLAGSFREFSGVSLSLPSNLPSGVADLTATLANCSTLVTVSGPEAWNTENVTTMYGTCYNSPNMEMGFVQNWNTAKVQRMQDCFRSLGAKDIPCDNWSIAGVTVPNSFENMFLSTTLPTARYDALLTRWEAQATKPTGATFHGGSSKYSAGSAAETARTSLANPATNNWTIVDGGRDKATDAVTDGLVLGDAATETVTGGAESETATDALILGDTADATTTQEASATDGLVLGDAIAGQGTEPVTVADGVVLGDAIAATVGTTAAITDGIALGDTLTLTTSENAALSDGLLLTGTAATAGVTSDALTDGLVLGDTLALSTTENASVTDGAILGDSVAITTTQPVTSADGLVLGDTAAADSTGVTAGVASDGLVVGDAAATTVGTTVAVADGLVLGDSAAESSTGVEAGTATDGLVLGDDATAAAGTATTLADGLVWDDDAAPAAEFVYSVSSGFSMADSVALQLDTLAGVTDGLVLGDLPTARSDERTTASDGLVWGDLLAAETTEAEAAYVGKYAPEHAAALEAVKAATGFSAEHASALAMIAEAGR